MTEEDLWVWVRRIEEIRGSQSAFGERDPRKGRRGYGHIHESMEDDTKSEIENVVEIFRSRVVALNRIVSMSKDLAKEKRIQGSLENIYLTREWWISTRESSRIWRDRKEAKGEYSEQGNRKSIASHIYGGYQGRSDIKSDWVIYRKWSYMIFIALASSIDRVVWVSRRYGSSRIRQGGSSRIRQGGFDSLGNSRWQSCHSWEQSYNLVECYFVKANSLFGKNILLYDVSFHSYFLRF
ncbi:unnamed protein product [Cochlearia groenlandica]